MEISELKAFLAVAETASFSRAADQLYLTQPAVSKRVSGLEEKLDIRLFDRIGRRVTLTEAGQRLLPSARQIIGEIANIHRSIANLNEEIGGTLTMATSHHIGLRRLPPVLKAYSHRFPKVKLDIRFMDSETACTEVEQGILELAIVTLPPEPPLNLKVQEIWCDMLHFVVAKDHPLARMQEVHLADLAIHPAVLASWGTYTREILEKAMKPYNLHLNIGMSTNYLETLKMMVSIGLGWSLLPETMTGDDDLKRLTVNRVRLTRPLGVVYHRGRTLSNSAKAMLETCQDFGENRRQ
ncbi:MAG: LysR family transcriptional regulator [Gammaproteobacteria bacterium]|nr:LysR family transcriptional regulator [Gammaproteobacteria bacterium]